MARNLIVNPDSAFVKVASGSTSEQGGYRARFLGDPGQTYTFQFVLSFPLSPTAIPWQTPGTRTADAIGNYSIVEISPAGTPIRFYRSIFP